MKKSQVIEQIQVYLSEEMEALPDTEGSESGGRRLEIERLLLMYRFLPARELEPGEVIAPAALVELEFNGIRAFYYIVPQGGGLVTSVEGRPVQVITPQSPLGEKMMGMKSGDCFSVEVAGGKREYRIVGVV